MHDGDCREGGFTETERMKNEQLKGRGNWGEQIQFDAHLFPFQNSLLSPPKSLILTPFSRIPFQFNFPFFNPRHLTPITYHPYSKKKKKHYTTNPNPLLLMTSLTRTKFNHIVMNDIWALGFLITYKPVSLFPPFVVFFKSGIFISGFDPGGGNKS